MVHCFDRACGGVGPLRRGAGADGGHPDDAAVVAGAGHDYRVGDRAAALRSSAAEGGEGGRGAGRERCGERGGAVAVLFCRRGGQRRGARKPCAALRLSEKSRKIRPIRRADAPGRAALRPAGHGQDAAGPSAGRRGRRALLRAVGFGFRGKIRGCGREPHPRSVQAGAQGRANA